MLEIASFPIYAEPLVSYHYGEGYFSPLLGLGTRLFDTNVILVLE